MSEPGKMFMNFGLDNHKVPEFKEVKNKDWVYYGEDNLYPEYLIEQALRSAKHGAILSGKVNYIYGGGLHVVEKGASLSAKAQAYKFIRQMNDDNFIRKMIQDFEWFNGFYIEPILTKSGKVESINYIPFAKIRSNKEETKLYYSNDWRVSTKQDYEKTGYKEFGVFDFNDPQPDCLFYYKIVSPKNGRDRNVYPVPEYIGACASIETDVEIANYHLNNIKTGFAVGTIVNFNNGVPEQSAQDQIERMLKAKFQGTDKAGSVAITFNASSDNAPTITSFVPNDLDKQFIEIAKRVEQDIFTGHKITNPALFGVNATGVVFQRDDLLDSFELFQNTYTTIRQEALERVLNDFANLQGVSAKIEFKRVQAVQNVIPQAAVDRVYAAYDIEQLIDILGLPKIQKKVDIKLSKENEVEEIFAKYGSVSDGEILFEKAIEGGKDFDFGKFETQLLMTFKKELTPNEKAIIDLLSKDSLMPTDAIAKTLKISKSEVNDMISALDKGGYLTVNELDITPTLDGEVAIEEGTKTDKVVVEYKYTWRPGVTPDKKHSREFCVNRLNEASAGKTYSSSDLIAMSNDLGTNVWEFRGGWWNKNGTNLPYCRHIWSAVVKRK